MLKRLTSISTLSLLGVILFLATPRMVLSQTNTLVRPGFWAERRDLSIVAVTPVAIRCLPHLACSSGTITVTCEGAPRQYNNFCAACCPEGSDCGNNPSLCRQMSPCNDTDACTEDLCEVDGYDNCEFAEASCIHRPLPTDDGNKCTQDSCDSKIGVKNEPLPGIDDGNLCTEDKCDAAAGNITHTPVAMNDGNACTEDSCDSATGLKHLAINFDDGNPCTKDSCDPAKGVLHEAIPNCPPPSCGNGTREPDKGEECDDGNTQAGDGCNSACTKEPVCGNTILEGSEQCDDGNRLAGDGCDVNCRREQPPVPSPIPPPPPPPPPAEQPMFICFTGKEVVIDGSTGKETPIEESYRCPRLATLTALGTEQFQHAISINEAYDDVEDDPTPENLKRFHDAIQNYVLYRAKMHMTDETERLREQEYPNIFGVVLLGRGEKSLASLGLLSQESLTKFHQKLLTQDLVFKDGKILKKTDLTQSGGQTGALMVQPSAVQLPEEPPIVSPLWAVDRLQAVGGGCNLIR